jgi:hypothetical protein
MNRPIELGFDLAEALNQVFYLLFFRKFSQGICRLRHHGDNCCEKEGR